MAAKKACGRGNKKTVLQGKGWCHKRENSEPPTAGAALGDMIYRVESEGSASMASPWARVRNSAPKSTVNYG